MRKFFVILHRWLGLAIAIFLAISGLTGAVISWDHELDEWLNPKLFQANSTGTPQAALALANQLEQSRPELQVGYLPLGIEPGHTLGLSVAPKLDSATGKAYPITYNQVAMDPVSGQIQGQRMWGAVSLHREDLLPFLYKLHYTMHIPDGFGLELGMLFMGIIGIIWFFDSFAALVLSFPNLKGWRKSFSFRWRQGGHKLNFDLHRSGGVWIWLFLLLLATTSISMNLNSIVMRPLVSLFSTLSASPFDTRTPRAADLPAMAGISREQVLELARQEASKRGWQAPAGGIFYSPAFDVYGVGFFEPGHDHGDGGLGNPWLYFDGQSGKSAGDQVPGTGSAGDIFMQAQFPLHSGRIIGLPGRIMISAMGLLVGMLSITGIIIWLRKRRARRHQLA